MENIKTLIFDYGGTLDTDARHWAHVLFEGYQHAEIPVSETLFRDAYVFGERALAKAPIVKPDDDFLNVLLKKVDQETAFLVENKMWTASEAERRAGIEKVAHYCNAYVERNMTITRKVLAALAPHYNMVLVSNFYGNIHEILKQYGIDGFFSAVVESAVVGVRKPDPKIYQLGVDAAGCLPSEAIVVGDSYGKDMVPAKKVGCHAVWMRGEGWAAEEVDELLPDAIIYHLPELLGVLGK